MRHIRFLVLPTAVVAACLLAVPPVALAQGYQGLFGDDGAPAQTAPAADPDQPPGYQGLIPGAVPPPAAAQAPPSQVRPPQTATTPQAQQAPQTVVPPSTALTSTPAPMAALGMTPIRSSDDLRKLAMIYSIDKNLDQIPDAMAAQFRLPETSTELLKQPRARINGMLPMERDVKNAIDGALLTLTDKGLRPADRAARAKLALDSLKSMQGGLKIKGQVSDRTYQVMGMPATYVKEEREAITKSLAHIEAAIKQVQGR